MMFFFAIGKTYLIPRCCTATFTLESNDKKKSKKKEEEIVPLDSLIQKISLPPLLPSSSSSLFSSNNSNIINYSSMRGLFFSEFSYFSNQINKLNKFKSRALRENILTRRVREKLNINSHTLMICKYIALFIQTLGDE